MPGEVEISGLSGEIDHLVVRVGGAVEVVVGLGGGPVEEREGLVERDAVADGGAFLDDGLDDGGGD